MLLKDFGFGHTGSSQAMMQCYLSRLTKGETCSVLDSRNNLRLGQIQFFHDNKEECA